MFVKGQFRRRCWQTSDGPLEVEGGLLSGQAVSLEKVGAAGRQIVIKTAVGVGHFASQARPPIVALHAGEVAVHLAGDVTLEDAHDLGLGAAFEGASFDVGAGPWVRAHAGEHDAPQGVVGEAVAAAVEPVTDRSCRTRRGSGRLRRGGRRRPRR